MNGLNSVHASLLLQGNVEVYFSRYDGRHALRSDDSRVFAAIFKGL